MSSTISLNLRWVLALAFATLTVALTFADRLNAIFASLYAIGSLVAFFPSKAAGKWRTAALWTAAIVASLLWLDLVGFDLQFLMGWTIADRIDPSTGVMSGYIPNLWLVAAKVVLALRCTGLARSLSRMPSPPPPPPPSFNVPLWQGRANEKPS